MSACQKFYAFMILTIIKNKLYQDEPTNISETELPNRRYMYVSYKVIVFADKWEAMKPESLVYGNKQYMTLKRRVWTHIIAEKIYSQYSMCRYV